MSNTNLAVNYNDKKVVCVKADGSFCISTNGWRSPRLKHKLNTFLNAAGWSVSQSRGIWYLMDEHSGKRYLFEDDMSITEAGEVVNGIKAPFSTLASSEAIKGYATHVAKLWSLNQISPPGSGDPWNLYIRTVRPCKLDDDFRLYMSMYVRRNYYCGSLIMAALEDISGGDSTKIDVVDKVIINEWLKMGTVKKGKMVLKTATTIESILRRYLFKVFGENK